MTYIYNKNELYHWGIKGQKWGIRRFQNEDGSLTPEGRKRYDYDERIKKAKQSIKDTKYNSGTGKLLGNIAINGLVGSSTYSAYRAMGYGKCSSVLRRFATEQVGAIATSALVNAGLLCYENLTGNSIGIAGRVAIAGASGVAAGAAANAYATQRLANSYKKYEK